MWSLRGGMWSLQRALGMWSLQRALVEALPGHTRSCGWIRRHLLLATLRCPACLRFDYNAGTMRGKTGAMADRASACCACSFRPPRATVRQRRTQRKKAAQAAFSVCGREDAAEIDAPVPVLPIPHCTALDGQDFNACCTSIAQDFNARCTPAVAIPGCPRACAQ
jgi:hypothetical protein